MMEKIVGEFVDDDVRSCGVLVGSSSVMSTSACTKCLCGIESSMMTSCTQKNFGRRFIGCSKYKVRI
jgi:hypothetical protein